MGFGEKRSVWYDFFEKADREGLDMFFSSGKDAYLGNRLFQHVLAYRNGAFHVHSGTIRVDAVYDRSASDHFPAEDIDDKTLNPIDFKWLCWDKNKTYELLGEFMPRSVKIMDTADLAVQLQAFAQDALVVLKPTSDFGGRGIVIDYPKNLAQASIEKEHVLQEFVDTSHGIEGILEGLHDLRIVVVRGQIVLAHVRTPRTGSYLANVAQGGSIAEVSPSLLPAYVLNVALKIKEKIDERFNKPIYSIDMGIAHGRPYVFEINDQIGFPLPDMKNKNAFIDALVASLAERARR